MFLVAENYFFLAGAAVLTGPPAAGVFGCSFLGFLASLLLRI